MGKAIELSEQTYQQLTALAKQHQRSVEEMLHLCLEAYEGARYSRAHQQMLTEGVLVSFPLPPTFPGDTDADDDFEPIPVAGKPVSEMIMEDRR